MSTPDPVPMYPIMLNVSDLTTFVVGADAAAADRAAVLAEHGARRIVRFEGTLPTAADFAAHAPRLVFVTSISNADKAAVRDLATAAGALVHVQDDIPRCDFHLPARLRRGKLLVTVSTDGAVAGLSRLVRDYLAHAVFGVEWAARVDELAQARRVWKSRGLTMNTLFEAIADHVTGRGWLPRRPQRPTEARNES
ncbi:MAG: siroheme synthase [Rhodospirillaceae bacterium]|nr:siroheme synthase [Rhodospirillaceae bacterium]